MLTYSIGVKPHTEAILYPKLKTALPPGKELYLNLTFTLRDATNWAESGHVVATGQLRLTPPKRLTQLLAHQSLPPFRMPNQPALTTTRLAPGIMQIATNTPTASTWIFDLTQGQLTSWTRAGTLSSHKGNILASPLTFDIFRALTNNDQGGDDPNGVPGSQGREWTDARAHFAKNHRLLLTHSALDGDWTQTRTADGTDILQLTVQTRISPSVLGWGIDVTATYRFMANAASPPVAGSDAHDALHIHVAAKGSGAWFPASLPRFGLVTSLRGGGAAARWFGRGPGESYRDKKESQLVGTYTAGEQGLFTDYDVPQENGNRTDVRWVELYGSAGGDAVGGSENRLLKARFGSLEGASFSASRYTVQELGKARHPFELRALAAEREGRLGEQVTWLHLDWAHTGLGTGSCGPRTRPEYTLDQREFDFEIILE